MRLGILVTAAIAAPLVAWAHPAPNSQVRVDLSGAPQVRVTIPIPELAAAMGRDITPETLPNERGEIEAYLLAHIGMTSGDRTLEERLISFAGARHEDHEMLEATIAFGAPARGGRLTLHYDAVNQQVASHYALVYRNAGGVEEPLVRLQSPDTTVDLMAAQPALLAREEAARRSNPLNRDAILGTVFLSICALFAFRELGHIRRERRKKD